MEIQKMLIKKYRPLLLLLLVHSNDADYASFKQLRQHSVESEAVRRGRETGAGRPPRIVIMHERDPLPVPMPEHYGRVLTSLSQSLSQQVAF